MCGIAAVINGTKTEALQMGYAIRRRGTKHSIESIDSIHVSFAHLPITDGNAPGQPFQCQEYFVWLNGYISNYKELAEEFKIPMSTNCDTEFLAGFIAKFGAENLDRLNGFFAVLVYDTRKKDFWAFTDRYGIKQLYIYWEGNKAYIASEIKAILAVVPLKFSDRGISDFRYSLGVMNTDTIYEKVYRVNSLEMKKVLPCDDSYDVACEKLDDLLCESMGRNKVRDSRFKTGVFLSGGVDSGIVASLMEPNYSFSMDYKEPEFSEYNNIKNNSQGIHHTIICNEDLWRFYRDKSIRVLDDLKAGSCYTNLALTELASKFCTILYSGAGGDEVFGGYPHRQNKPLRNVIKRTAMMPEKYIDYKPELTLEEYNWLFLRAVLTVEDRMTGYFAMETRYPLLDNDFVDYARSLPMEYKVNKRILKEIGGLSPEVNNGPKHGFSNPYFTNDEWTKFAIDETRRLLHSIRRTGTIETGDTIGPDLGGRDSDHPSNGIESKNIGPYSSHSDL